MQGGSILRLLNPMVLAVMVVLPLELQAAVLTFTDRTAWEAAVSGTISTETFDNDIAHADVITFDNGVTSTATPSGSSTGNSVSSGVFNGRVDSANMLPNPGFLTFDFGGLITGFGADFEDLDEGETTLNIGSLTFFAGLYSSIGGPDGFFGLVSDTAFSDIVLYSIGGDDIFLMDNMSTVSATVPEPATLALFGFAALGVAARRRKTH
jgi:hypothetical protein